jgi:hypothetical protein
MTRLIEWYYLSPNRLNHEVQKLYNFPKPNLILRIGEGGKQLDDVELQAISTFDEPSNLAALDQAVIEGMGDGTRFLPNVELAKRIRAGETRSPQMQIYLSLRSMFREVYSEKYRGISLAIQEFKEQKLPEVRQWIAQFQEVQALKKQLKAVAAFNCKQHLAGSTRYISS